MRLRILITAASLISLAVPAYAAVAAPPGLDALPALRSATTARDMAVEAALLRALMIERHDLIARLAAQDGWRGRLLTLAALATADAVLSGDDAALRRAIDHARRAAARSAATRRRAASTTTDLWLTPASPGALWSPSARALAPGPLAWDLTGRAATRAPARVPLTPPFAMSLAALTSWSSLLRAATAATPTPRPAGPVSSYLLPRAARTSAWPEPAAPAPLGLAALLGDAALSAPPHGQLAIDPGNGPVQIAAANPTVAAAELAPAVSPARQAHHTGRASTAAPTPRTERPPDLAALLRRWQAVTAALARVRAIETWAWTNAPTPLITPNDLIPSPDVLHQRLDEWAATIPVPMNPISGSTWLPAVPSGTRSTATASTSSHAQESRYAMVRQAWHVGHPPVVPIAVPSPGPRRPGRQGEAVPPEALGATLALTAATGSPSTAAVAISATLASHGSDGVSTSSISDTAATDMAATELSAPVALSPLPTSTVTATVGIIPTATVTGTAATGLAAMATTAPSPTQAATADATTTSYGSTAQPALQTGTPTPAQSASASSSAPTAAPGYSPSTTALPGTSATVSATTPLTPSPPVTSSAILDLAIDGATPALTITTALSATSPLTLMVTLPVTAAQALVPAGFPSQRLSLESVLRRGEALYAHMQASEQVAEQNYRAQLNTVVSLNTVLENGWYRRYNAYLSYRHAFPAYERRVAAFNAYAHRVHLARLQREQWQQRMAAWTRYAQDMAAYKVALAARQQAPVIPVSGTVPLTPSVSAPLPPRPVQPPFPGPEPPPFTEQPPAWPGAPPVYAADPGPEPSGYPLPLPPLAVPPWEAVAVPIAVMSYGGMAPGVGAAGYEETTQAALLANGALDLVGSYQDPIKGIITTYFGGRTIFQSFHPAIDIAAPMYTPIHAAAAGRVIWAGYAVPGQRHDSYGLCVIIQHNEHFSTLYAHMDDEKNGLQVRQGESVQQGQVIGYVGMTGWTTGPHLHFEMRDDNVQFNPLLLIPNPQD